MACFAPEAIYMLISGSVMLLNAGPPSQLWNCCKLKLRGRIRVFLVKLMFGSEPMILQSLDHVGRRKRADSTLDLRQRWSFGESFEVGLLGGERELVVCCCCCCCCCGGGGGGGVVSFCFEVLCQLQRCWVVGSDLPFDLGRWVSYFCGVSLKKQQVDPMEMGYHTWIL